MADNDIEIKIAATGGGEAAEEVQKVATAGEGVSRGMGGQAEAMRELAEERETAAAAAEEQTRVAKAQTEATQAQTEALEDEAEAQRAVAEDDRGTASGGGGGGAFARMKNLAAATAAVGLAAKASKAAFDEVRAAVDSVDIDHLRAIDPALADAIEGAKGLSDWLSNPIGQLVALANGGTTVTEAFKGMNEQLAASAEQRSASIDRMIARGIVQVDELKRLTDELKRANDLLDAKDRVTAAKRDRADAAAIRGGAAPEDVAIRRAQADGADRLAKIDRELAEKEAGLPDLFANAQKARRNLEKIDDMQGDENYTPAEKKKAQKDAREAVDATKAEYETRRAEADQAAALAEQRREEVRERTAAAVENARAAKEERLEKQRAAAEDKAAREQEKQDRARAAAEAKAAREQERRNRNAGREADGVTKDAAGVGEKAVKLLPPGVSGRFREAVNKAASGLQDGDQGGELKELSDLMEKLAAATLQGNRSRDASMQKLRSQVAILEGQIKMARTGR